MVFVYILIENINFDEEMKKNEQTLQHLSRFRLLILEQIYLEGLYRENLWKKRPKNLSQLLIDSYSYQRFLQKLLQDVFDDITL